MNKIFYITDSFVQLVDYNKIQREDGTPKNIVSWQNKKGIEALFKFRDKEKVSVILDFSTENINFSWVPKLLPWEKTNYEKQIKNKFIANSGELIKLDWLQEFKKNKDGASQQLILNSSIRSSEDLNYFFSLVEESEVAITSIHSYSFLLEKYFLDKIVPDLDVEKGDMNNPLLLVFQEGKHSFRQMFFSNSILRITRSIELNAEIDGSDALAAALAKESISLITYTYSHLDIKSNSPVGFVYIATNGMEQSNVVEQFDDIVPFSNKNKKTLSKCIDMSGNEEVVGLEKTMSGMVGFLSNFIRTSNPPSFYSSALLKRVKQALMFKDVLMFSIATTFIIGTIYFVNLTVNDYLLGEKLVSMDEKLQQYKQEKIRLQKKISLKYDAEDIKATIDFSNSILAIKGEKVLKKSLYSLSKSLTKNEHILVSSIDWKTIKNFDSKVASIEIEGWVYPFSKSYEQPVEWVDLLVADLRGMPEIINIELTKEPLDRSLQKSIVISTGKISLVKALPFSLKIKIGVKNVKRK